MAYSTQHIDYLKGAVQEAAEAARAAKTQWKHADSDESAALEAVFQEAKKARKFATLELEAAEAENALAEPVSTAPEPAAAPAPAPAPAPVGGSDELDQRWSSWCRQQGRNLTARPEGWGE